MGKSFEGTVHGRVSRNGCGKLAIQGDSQPASHLVVPAVETNLLSTPFSERPRTEPESSPGYLATLSGVKALAELASEQKVPRKR